jgi:hypothetical protein
MAKGRKLRAQVKERSPTAEPLHLIENDNGDRLLIYAAKEGINVDLRVADDTFWATQQQMADMFGVSVATISRHLKNVFDEGELDPAATVTKNVRVRSEGERSVAREIEFYIASTPSFRLATALAASLARCFASGRPRGWCSC